MATIGGNICTASPAGDTLPPLYLLGAELELWAQAGTRRVALEQFISGPGRTALTGDEILAGIRLKKGEEFNIHHFEKVGRRKALAISIASLTALVRATSSGIIEKIRLAWGSVGPTIITSKEAEKALTGLPLTAESLRCAFPFINDAVSPISDIRASAAYRRAVSANLALRLAQYGPHT
jgi:CO/xanthine dehydrogenase FAD-binding subunit